MCFTNWKPSTEDTTVHKCIILGDEILANWGCCKNNVWSTLHLMNHLCLDFKLPNLRQLQQGDGLTHASDSQHCFSPLPCEHPPLIHLALVPHFCQPMTGICWLFVKWNGCLKSYLLYFAWETDCLDSDHSQGVVFLAFDSCEKWDWKCKFKYM